MAAATYDCLPAPCPHLACTGESGDAGIARAQALTLQARGAYARRMSAQELAQGASAPVGLGARGLSFYHIIRAAQGGLKCAGMGVSEQGIRVTSVSACIRRDDSIYSGFWTGEAAFAVKESVCCNESFSNTDLQSSPESGNLAF